MKNISLLTLLLFGALLARGQTIEPEVWVSNANYYDLEAQGFSLHTSLGEIATEYLSEGVEQSVSQGFLQNFIDAVPVRDTELLDLSVQVGPNPCTDYLSVTSNQEVPLQLELFDLYGRRLKTAQLQHMTVDIDLADLPASQYFLLVRYDDQLVFETIKIVKL